MATDSASSQRMRCAFAGDRDIAVNVLDYLLSEGARPLALFVSGADRESHADALIARCSYLHGGAILRGAEFRSPPSIRLLRELELDLVISVHFPYLVPEEVLRIPRIGVLNLHPAYLPYNRGWHTPSWSILDGTPAGATLHFMDSRVDTGDIVHQQRLDVSPADTSQTLYERLKRLELEVFRQAWPKLADGCVPRTPQRFDCGTTHKRLDLLQESVQRIELDVPVRARDLLTKLRALTTNRLEEAAFFEMDSKRYRVRVAIDEE